MLQGRGLVMDALDELVTASQIPLPMSLLTQLLHRGFSAHVLQVARGEDILYDREGILPSFMTLFCLCTLY